MPESTCLHIQDRESGPIRVVELAWISVRIGRAAYCEVRLPDARIGDEACRLTRKGRMWTLIPASGEGPILLEGRPLAGACPLPFDVPFRLGPYCLTLRHDVAAEPDWELYPSSEPPAVLDSPRSIDPADSSPGGAEEAVADGERPTAAEPSERARRPVADPDRWRARWKAAEAHLKARAARLDTGPRTIPHAVQSDGVRGSDWSPPAPPSRVASPVGVPPRPVAAPSTPLIEPTWETPRPDPCLSTPRIDPKMRSTPSASLRRLEPTTPPSSEPPCAPPAPASTPPTEASAPDQAPQLPHSIGRILDTAGMDGRDASLGESEAEPRDDLDRSEADVPPFPASASDDPLSIDVPAAIDPAAPAEPTGIGMADTRGPIEPPLGPEPQAIPSEGTAVPDRSRARFRSRGASGAREGRGSSALEEATGASSRPIDRGPRRRKPPRDRTGAGRRSDALRRPRHEGGPSDSNEDNGVGPETSIPDVELPSVRDILAGHRNCPGPRPAVDRPRRRRQPVPTVPQEPGQWTLPGWLALPPVGACSLVVGLVACVLSWWWARDASNASVITRRLLAAEGSGRRRPLPEGFTPPGGRWIKTTAQHLAHWGIFLAGEEKDERYPAAAAPAPLHEALEVSPLNPTARLAVAQLGEPGRDGGNRTRGVGLSRDSVSLAWSARGLMDAGKKEAALRLYGRALSAAADSGLSRSATPRFSDHPAVSRYLLPAEDAVRDIVAELTSRQGLEFREWSGALPRHPVVLLATARLLREQGRPEADGLLDELLADGETRAAEGRVDPRLLAARAEALTLRSRWADAAEQYRRAIEQVDNDLIRRSWWFNLADIAQRLNDEGQRQAAIRAALAVASSDDITRRASQVQGAGGSRARPRYGYGSARAN